MLEILDERDTELGTLTLRCRFSPSHEAWIFEVLLAGEFLMSSAVKDAEEALAHEGLRGAPAGGRVLVGGLGLGYTAACALAHPTSPSVTVVELLHPVIDWHRRKLVPSGLFDDPACTIVHDDFFRLAAREGDAWDAILLDIDHSPDALLHARHAEFYDGGGAARMAERVSPGGAFALWSADPPGPGFLEMLDAAFSEVRRVEVEFDVPHMDTTDRNWIVVARKHR